MKRSRLFARACLGALLALTPALGSGPAGAADLDDLRARAQSVGEQVSGLEQRLADLDARQADLDRRVEESSSELARLESDIQIAEVAYEAAQDEYVERAVEAYKAGPTGHLELLLGARDLDDVFILEEAGSRAAESDAAALDALLDAKESAETMQAQVDAHKQQLLNEQARVDLLAERVDATLDDRRSLLADLETEIAQLEAEARRLAALAPNPTAAFKDLIAGTGPTTNIPKGFVGTGVVIEGTASWYGPGFHGNATASGAIFDTNQFTAASKELPLNSWLYVEYNGKGVVVLVNDRGPYHDDWILDLSHAAADALGIVGSGTGWVRAEVLLKV